MCSFYAFLLIIFSADSPSVTGVVSDTSSSQEELSSAVNSEGVFVLSLLVQVLIFSSSCYFWYSESFSVNIWHQFLPAFATNTAGYI